MQVRHYSSGMYVRLGFAVAVNVDPDILLVDEVLSVGDESFQRKCLDRVAQFQREGPHDPVRHPRGRPRAPDLRARDRARPRSARRRRAAGRSGAHVPRDVATLGPAPIPPSRPPKPRRRPKPPRKKPAPMTHGRQMAAEATTG